MDGVKTKGNMTSNVRTQKFEYGSSISRYHYLSEDL